MRFFTRQLLGNSQQLCELKLRHKFLKHEKRRQTNESGEQTGNKLMKLLIIIQSFEQY